MTIHKTLISIQSWMSTIHAQEPIDTQILEQAVKKSTIFAVNRELVFCEVYGIIAENSGILDDKVCRRPKTIQ